MASKARTLNWGDQDRSMELARQLGELFRGKSLTCEQVSSIYSIKHGKSVASVLQALSHRAGEPMSLADFLKEHAENFHFDDAGKVSCTSLPSAAASPAIATTRPALTLPSRPAMAAGALRPPTLSPGIVGTSPVLTASLPAGETAMSLKDERFVVDEFRQLVEQNGPVCYISSLCGKFIQRNGRSVTSIVGGRPNDLFKKRHDVFLLVGGGNVTLRKYREHPEVIKLMGGRTATRAAPRVEEPVSLPPPTKAAEKMTEQDVVEEFVRLVDSDRADTVYISSLCGRFLQRYQVPVTSIIEGRPADFLRKFPETFVMTGGGNVGLRSRLGPDVESVPAPPPRKKDGESERVTYPQEELDKVVLTDEILEQILERIAPPELQSECEALATKVAGLVEENNFLAVDRAYRAGSAFKGVAAARCADLEVTLAVRQLPAGDQLRWLPPILDTLHAVLETSLADEAATAFRVEHGRVTFTVENKLRVFVKVQSDAEPCRAEEQAAFVNKQPEAAKRAIRLVKWWASFQKWSSLVSTPSGYLLELVAANTVRQLQEAGRKAGLLETLSATMEALSKLSALTLLWADSGLADFELDDIPAAMLEQQPLILDPCHAGTNLADPAHFDTHSLADAARAPAWQAAFQAEVLSHAAAQAEQDE